MMLVSRMLAMAMTEEARVMGMASLARVVRISREGAGRSLELVRDRRWLR